MDFKEWSHKDEWRKPGKNFQVVISRHSGLADEFEGEHRWAVYAYLYPKHELFSSFSGPDIFQPSALNLPLHHGCSYLRYHEADGVVTSVQVGADYHHLHDDDFTFHGTPEDAYRVFEDADSLHAFLTRYEK